MSIRVIVRPSAKRDLADIAVWLMENASDRVAVDILGRIEAKIDQLRDLPLIGAPRDDLAPRVRILVEHPYVILHRASRSEADILRIVHGARDLPSVLREA